MDSLLELIGSGCGGVDEMRSLVNPQTVQWALARFEIGTGSFRRQKVLFLHLNSDGCPIVARGHLNGNTANVMDFLRKKCDGFHASLELRTKADFTAEAILKRVHHIFVSDELDNYSIEAMLADYEKQIAGMVAQTQPIVTTNKPIFEFAKPECLEVKNAEITRPAPTSDPITSYNTGREALRSVGDPRGDWNWVVVAADPKLDFVSGGNGSIDEMRDFLNARQDTVLYGMLRLSFGIGRLRRIKHVFVHAVGEKTSIVRRGRLNAVRPQMRQAFAKFADCPVSLEIMRSSDLSIELVVEKVRRASTVDDTFLDGDSVFSVEALRSGIETEVRNAKVVEPVMPAAKIPTICEAPVVEILPSPKKTEGEPKITIEKAVYLVSQLGSQVNWALFDVNYARLRMINRRGRSAGA